ncbi:nucleotidyltransferase [Xylanibacillus composti]|uniref:Nucleotidyltransferase n=1 Tax=Xylanibacillus composti TaxID=1572762 RepID=A0A8J4M352_9BACL|nr:nucleotidyltransferase domain-containing protein [Xylanibacillus composti]GIQ69622.1 nucleotidyltransferase [Xylanibacillus composti]
MEPILAAKLFVESNFHQSPFALAAGSVIRGEGTITSDLDIVIVDDCIDRAYRESFHAYGWPIEVFVHNEQTVREYFDHDIQRRRPSLVNMVAEGILIKDLGALGKGLKELAHELLAAGPAPFTPEESETRRYIITDLLDDLIGAQNYDEQLFISYKLVEQTCNFLLVNRQEWMGRGKWVPRLLKRSDEASYQILIKALKQLYVHQEKQPLIDWIVVELEKYGGRCFAGYSRGKP